MSGGDKNKKKARTQGWEEAGAEFYQESYPSIDTDFEVLQRDPKQLATLLPSKQTRVAAGNLLRKSINVVNYYMSCSNNQKDTHINRHKDIPQTNIIKITKKFNSS